MNLLGRDLHHLRDHRLLFCHITISYSPSCIMDLKQIIDERKHSAQQILTGNKMSEHLLESDGSAGDSPDKCLLIVIMRLKLSAWWEKQHIWQHKIWTETFSRLMVLLRQRGDMITLAFGECNDDKYDWGEDEDGFFWTNTCLTVTVELQHSEEEETERKNGGGEGKDGKHLWRDKSGGMKEDERWVSVSRFSCRAANVNACVKNNWDYLKRSLRKSGLYK